MNPSFRSQFVTKRTYNRPLDEDGTIFETFDQTINRVIEHQRWLWETAKGKLIGEDIDQLTAEESAELEELRQLMLKHEAMVSGRTLWLGGTDIAKKFHATQFNCSFSQIRTIHDLVDAFHNLLLGVGVGFEPITGILNGFAKPVEIEIIRSTRLNRGDDNNKERHYKRGDKRVWQLIVGDSGIAWAKAVGKLIAMKKPVDVIILDFSEVRPGGKPLKGFGWISSGDEQISRAFYEICLILNRRADELLTRIDILDIMNWLGTSLSSRRSAEIAIMPADDPEAEEFSVAKKDYWKTGNPQRSQSNNSLTFYHKPTKRELRGLFSQMLASGGSEPGFLNGAVARKRAPYFRGVNPCLPKDALVYVADGRGAVSIGQLAEEENDVPVFCFDDHGDVTVRTMRNPRLTGKNQQIYKITLDDNNVLRATGNHKFLLSDGTYREVKDMRAGDSLNLISRQVKTLDEVYTGIDKNASDSGYYVIVNNRETIKFEHRLIGEFIFNGIKPGFSVHHKNWNSKDNSHDNLEYMKTEDHVRLHMSGDNNPMRRAKNEWDDSKWDQYRKNMSLSTKESLNGNYSGFTNKDLQNIALTLTKKLGRRFTEQDWCEFADMIGAPKFFSNWRNSHLGGIYGLACWAANKCGYVNHSMHPRTYRLYDKLINEGYRCEITEDGNDFVIIKNCEHCGKEFEVHPKMREIGYCSRSCSAKHNPIILERNQEFRQALKTAHQKHHESKKIKQIQIFNNLKSNINRLPTKQEWINQCKKENTVYRLGTNCSFPNFSALTEYANNYNHRVVSVELDGFEDVYNGTVDQFHNFFTGGFEDSENKKMLFFNNLNCGEILLGEKSFCNLVTINLSKFNGREKDLHRAAWIMGRANYRQTCVDFRDPILQNTWHELNQFLRLTGVSCAGIVTWEHHMSPKHLSKLRKVSKEAVDSMAIDLNLPKSKAVTCIKPDGCAFFETKIKLSDNSILSLLEIFEKCGYSKEDIINEDDRTWLSPNIELQVLDENNEPQKITQLYINGVRPVYTVEFEDGNSYKFTGNHKLKTESGWKRVDELIAGEEIISF